MLDPLKSENCLGAVVKIPGLRWPVGTLEYKCWIQSESLVPRYSLGPLETATGFCVSCASWPLVFVRLQSFLVQSLWSLVCTIPSTKKDALTSFPTCILFLCLTALAKTFSFEVFSFWCDGGYRFVVYTLYNAEMCSSYFQCLQVFFYQKPCHLY